MNDISRESTSIWMTPEIVPEQPLLLENTSANVCVVGAGIAGMTTAYMLLNQGKSVVVLDDGPIGSGQTQRTTAHLSNAVDARYFEIERLHGEKGSCLVAESHTAAIDRIEAIIREEGIDCEFERLDGYLFVPAGESLEVLGKELEAAHRAGLTSVERIESMLLGSFNTGPCLRFPRQAQFHPLKYLAGLARAIRAKGGRIFTETHVDKVEGGFPVHVTTRSGSVVTADAVVVATNTPFNDLVVLHTKQASYRSYVIGAPVPHGVIPTSLFWDTGMASEGSPTSYHYCRVQIGAEQGTDTLIIGGEDHKTGQANDTTKRHARLEAWGRARFPMMGEVTFRWSGQVIEPIDGIAFIGRNPMDDTNVFIATGDSGMGMTHGTIAGIILTDLICGRENSWASLYDPSRKTIPALGQFALESFNVALQYGDWLTGGDVSSAEEIKTGCGAIVRQGLTKMAVYRDDQGILHKRLAVCPHLGGIVAWNDAEKTWDCPCHGSRFDPKGKVLNGPANIDLMR